MTQLTEDIELESGHIAFGVTESDGSKYYFGLYDDNGTVRLNGWYLDPGMPPGYDFGNESPNALDFIDFLGEWVISHD
jgi:hypothetical protein